MKFWVDGHIVEEKAAEVPLLTHSLHYGSGVFEGIRFYKTDDGPAIFRLADHIKRLFYSAEVLKMKIPFSPDEVERACMEVVSVNGLTDGYIRPLGYFGDKMGLDPQGADVHLAVAAWPWGKYLGEKVRVKTSPFMRIHPDSTEVTAKISGHYVNSILATREARQAGYDETLLLDADGKVAEGPGENIFFVQGSDMITPKPGSILPGITRDSVITLARGLGYQVQEKAVAPADISDFDEAFFTGTAVEITPIASIDETEFSRDDISLRIKDKYQAVTTGKANEHLSWLTYTQ